MSTKISPSVTAAEIAGITVSGVAIIVFGGIIAYFCGQRRYREHREIPQPPQQQQPTTQHQEEKPLTQSPGNFSISPLATAVHPSPNPYVSTFEYQQAVHNLLGFTPLDRQQWEYDRGIGSSAAQASGTQLQTHAQGQVQEQRRGSGSSLAEMPCSRDPGNSPLPEYEEVERGARFSWAVADENRYRPTKR